MQKKIIALAVAGLASTAAFAQSNVVVYGAVDYSYTNAEGKGYAAGVANKKQGINSGVWAASRLGFRGTEDLGNGLKASFVLEYGLNADDDTSIGGSREESLALSGNFGTAKVGHQVTLGHMAVGKFDAMRSSSFGPLNSFRGTTISNSSRAKNTIAYIAPNMSGVTLAATYSFDATRSNDKTAYGGATKQEKVIGLMADYTAGPLAVAYVHHRVDNLRRTADLDNRENFLAGSYDFGVVKAMATWQSDKRKNAAGTTTLDNRTWAIGVQVPVTAKSRVDVSYASLNDKLVANNDAKGWGLQYSYNMSPRTMAYAGYTHIDNKNGATFAALRGGDNNPGVEGSGVNGANSSGFGFGVRHTF